MNETLFDCLHLDAARFPEERLKAFGPEDWKKFGEQAIRFGIGSVVYSRLKEEKERILIDSSQAGDGYQRAMRMLQYYSDQIALENLRFFSELRVVLDNMDKAGIPVMILKGAWLAHDIYPDIRLRELSDMDIMVQPNDLAGAYEVAKGLGYAAKVPLSLESIIAGTDNKKQLPPMKKDNGVMLDLHWGIGSADQEMANESTRLWDHSREVSVVGKKARILSAEDMLLHLCYHLSHQHKFIMSMKSLYDIALLLKKKDHQPDWALVADIAVKKKWQKGTWLILHMAKELFGADVREDWLRVFTPEPVSGSAEMLSLLREHLKNRRPIAETPPAVVQELVAAGNPAKRLKLLMTEIKSRMVFLYTANRRSRKKISEKAPDLYAYSRFRLWDTLSRYSRKFFSGIKDQPVTVAEFDRQKKLESWLKER